MTETPEGAPPKPPPDPEPDQSSAAVLDEAPPARQVPTLKPAIGSSVVYVSQDPDGLGGHIKRAAVVTSLAMSAGEMPYGHEATVVGRDAHGETLSRDGAAERQQQESKSKETGAVNLKVFTGHGDPTTVLHGPSYDVGHVEYDTLHMAPNTWHYASDEV